MDTVPKRDPSIGGLVDQPPRHDLVSPVPVAGDVAWLPPAIPAPGETMTREDLFQLITSTVAAGAAAPVRIEFFTDGPRRELEIQMPDGDQAGVELFALVFDLHKPDRSTATVRRPQWEYAAFFGSSSARCAGGHEFGGWQIGVTTYVDATLGGAPC